MTDLWRLIVDDLRAKAEWNYQRVDGKALLQALATDGTAAMVLYRLMQWAGRRRLSPLALIFNKLNAVLNNCIIGRGADFGPRFVLIHATGVVINGAVRGGSDVRVEHQVTIGSRTPRAGVIGDRVFIGAGARSSAASGSETTRGSAPMRSWCTTCRHTAPSWASPRGSSAGASRTPGPTPPCPAARR
jgi:serine O-acetyltransferase